MHAMEQYIKIAADNVSELRKSDVLRVLDEAPEAVRKTLGFYIAKERPELAAEVNECVDLIDRDPSTW